MVRKALMLASCALSAFPVQAQTLSAGPYAGTFSNTPATYAAGTTPNVLGDGSNAKGGTAPAFTTYPENVVPEPTLPAGYVIAGGGGCAVQNPVTVGCPEKKARFLANSIAFRYDDPIRYYGQPGVSHCHEFIGYLYPSSRVTPISIRTRVGSGASGGIANNTVYWEPCHTKTIAGKKYAMPALYTVFYYSVELTPGDALVDDLQPLHLKLDFITGVNMDDPDDTVVKAEIATANAQSGTSGRYTYVSNGFGGYQCAASRGNGATVNVVNGPGAGGTITPYLTGPAGLDPWGGGCLAGYAIISLLSAPECWNGVDVSSPTGYRHFRHLVQDNALGGRLVCPNGWYKVPALQVKSFHETKGYADYSTWALDSDAAMSAKLTALGTPRTIYPGESLHADWKNGWRTTQLNLWLSKCLGIGTNAPHVCDTDAIDPVASLSLLSGSNSPDGKRVPQVKLDGTVDTSDPSQLFLIDKTRTATHSMRGM